MRYLCLVYLDEQNVMHRLTPAELQAVRHDCMRYDEELEASGHLIIAQALQGAETAMTVRVRDGRMSATDGPFTETKEVLGGFLLIEARDFNEAVRIAAGSPLARLGAIEVRPVGDPARPNARP
jgi:hypothetical protein